MKFTKIVMHIRLAKLLSQTKEIGALEINANDYEIHNPPSLNFIWFTTNQLQPASIDICFFVRAVSTT